MARLVCLSSSHMKAHASESESEYPHIWMSTCPQVRMNRIQWIYLLCIPVFLLKCVCEYMPVRVGLTDCVNVCACVCLAAECVEQALCVLSFSPCSADHWHLGPRGPQAPPRGPQHLLFLALPPLIFLIPLFLIFHLVFYMTKYYIWICANVTLINTNLCSVPSSAIYCFWDFKTLSL